MPDRDSRTAITDEQQAVLRFLSLAQGEGLTLAHDVAVEVGVSPRGMGQKLAALERRGLVARRLVRAPATVTAKDLYGWEVTDEGWKAADPVHNFTFAEALADA